MELILFGLGLFSIVSSVILYIYLVENKKIEPLIPPRYMGHGGFEVKYTEQDYKKFDKQYEEENSDTVQGQSDTKETTT